MIDYKIPRKTFMLREKCGVETKVGDKKKIKSNFLRHIIFFLKYYNLSFN